MIAPTFKARSTSPAVWRPGAPTPPPAPASPASISTPSTPAPAPPPPPPLPTWAPSSAGASPQTSRKSFRPVHFEETPPARRKLTNLSVARENGCASGSENEGRLRTSHSAPATGLNTLSGSSPTSTSRLPRAQNPTVTLLQKAREGQLPRGSNYLQERDSARLPRDRITPPRSDPVHALRREYASESEAERNDYERVGIRKMADAQRKVDGIGPTTKEGMPVALRSEVKDPSKWYKKMYDTIHKTKYDDDYVTIRYKSRRGQPGLQRVTGNKSQYAYFDPRSGYLSEPEGGISRLGSSTWSDAYDSDATSGPRRRTTSVQDDHIHEDISSPYLPNNKYSTLASARASQEVYKNQPGRIENYVPGKSSVVDKEAKQWWDEVMDIFDGWLDENSPLPPYGTLLARAIQKNQMSSTTSLPQASPKEKKDITSAILAKSNMARALKESGYESDSTLVFRRREEGDAPLSPAERRAAYRDLQAGGEPPLRGFRSPAPPRQDDSEIEYIPISPTLTKIRVHKKVQKPRQVICYPLLHNIDREEEQRQGRTKYEKPSCLTSDKLKNIENAPLPPRRISSRNSRTLKLVTSSRPLSASPNKLLKSSSQSNVDFLKDKLCNKLSRQNTHTIINVKKIPSADRKTTSYAIANKQRRVMSTSAPPAIDRKTNSVSPNISKPLKKNIETKISGTSSFSSPRKTLLPTEYNNPTYSKYGESANIKVVIEGGAGRKTPITNILDKVTSLDKLWSSEKRNEPFQLPQKKGSNVCTKTSVVRQPIKSNLKPIPTFHRGRDMIRTSDKLQKLKCVNMKSTPCLTMKSDMKTTNQPLTINISNIKKSSSAKHLNLKKHDTIKTAIITNLKSKKPLETSVIKPRCVPCHASCSKSKDSSKHSKVSKLKSSKKYPTATNDSETSSQFGESNDIISNFGSSENISSKKIATLNEIKKGRDAVVSDSFFQHLFLGNKNITLPIRPVEEQNRTVLQKAKMFQSFPQDYNAPKSINTYLIHRKPVSQSRFKISDRYPSIEKDKSRSISWPGRKHCEIRKFDSLSVEHDEFGSTSSLATIRSRSEPPTNKMYFSQTSRPKSPTVIFHKKEKNKKAEASISPSRLVFSETSRPVSPKIVHKVFMKPKEKVRSPSRIVFTETIRPISPLISERSSRLEYNENIEEKIPSKIIFSETSRPISPKVIKKVTTPFSSSVSRSHSTSPVTIRSPSYRRIHGTRAYGNKHEITHMKILRARSAGDAEPKTVEKKLHLKTHSDTNLTSSHDPDYDEYIQDMENMTMRSKRFRELNRYYCYLERVGELEKATSTCDLRHRKKDEEIIDFDRWKKIRSIERAEEELNNLYNKLRMAQSEKDLLFYPNDVTDFRWNHEKDWSLRLKEKSVEDLKDHFQQINESEIDPLFIEQPISKDTYKPLWRGTSVAETAYNINRKNDNICEDNKFLTVKPKVVYNQDSSLIELRRKIGLGSRLWSSLSMEQVNTLKNQLNAIYSKDINKTIASGNKCLDKYTVNVTNNIPSPPKLHVRSNSLITHIDMKEKEISKSDSIAAINCLPSVKEIKNNVNKIQMTLTENEKKRISQTLSKELLDRIKKFESNGLISDESTNVNQPSHTGEISTSLFSELNMENTSITNEENNNLNKPDAKRNEVYPIEKLQDTSHPSSASETETASSDISNKTVIYREPKKEVQKKVEYFESVKNVTKPLKTIYHARENSDEKQGSQNRDTIITEPTSKKKECKEKNENLNIKQSQSCTNLKELFGETEKNKFISLPPKPGRYSRSPSPYSEIYVDDRRTPDTLRYSSNETICRSRSVSPDPEHYWRAYLNLARKGEVRRLARRFDLPTFDPCLRRHRSDPELIGRSDILKGFNSMETYTDRLKRTISPVARVPLRPGNRFMPHIDIISKLAALRRRTAPRSRSADEVPECRPGEVERMRRRFETISLLGQIYASAPDVSELRDIAPYLTGPWIAHRYPRRQDNNKSIKDGNFIEGCTSPIRKGTKTKILPKESIKLSSILKSDPIAKQTFDPEAHRPTSRYEPPRAPPRPPPAAWPYQLAPFIMPHRHSVKFQENETTPQPPRRIIGGSVSDTESPRRYVESDVNIHYRCPVRRDPLPLVPERELAKQQAEHMRRLYREQRRTKYLQDINPLDIEAFDASIKELQDMQNRRHQDNFTPGQKTILPLNRYDEAEKVVARALYTFTGQTPRELSFRKGDLITVRRQVDTNWYEGELQGRIGLFPYNYAEILKGDVAQSQKKVAAIVEGRARAKFDFTAQTNLELPLKKGEVVVLTRRIDHNWWEGRRGSHTGIFPDSYVTILQEPAHNKPELPSQPGGAPEKPAGAPAAHGLVNGAARRALAAHAYTPQLNSPALANAPPATQPLPGYLAKPAQATLTPSERGYGPPTGAGTDLNNTEPLYVDTNAEAVPYRVMYKYQPQNPDELELREGDTVYVLERCDDGWYVGSSQRSGRFGTFPGNYVDRI